MPNSRSRRCSPSRTVVPSVLIRWRRIDKISSALDGSSCEVGSSSTSMTRPHGHRRRDYHSLTLTAGERIDRPNTQMIEASRSSVSSTRKAHLGAINARFSGPKAISSSTRSVIVCDSGICATNPTRRLSDAVVWWQCRDHPRSRDRRSDRHESVESAHSRSAPESTFPIRMGRSPARIDPGSRTSRSLKVRDPLSGIVKADTSRSGS